MPDSRSIGVFDSGLGGLTVAREIMKCLPRESIVYFGDTGRVPYGTRSRETIKKYAAEDENFLLKHNVKLIVAACGTVSSVAGEEAKNLPVPYFEMVTHAAEAAVRETAGGRIGVIATPSTIASGSHKRAILKLMPSAKVTACSCSLFVPLVEEGWYSPDDAVVRETAERYLEPVKSAQVDTLILGCTHYPVLSEAISRAMGNGVKLINPGVAVAEAVKDYLEKTGLCTDGKTASHSFYVTDKTDSFKALASMLLGTEIDENKVKQVELASLC